MKMCKTAPMFILLFTGYLCSNMAVAAETTTLSQSSLPTSKATQAPEAETPPHGSDDVPEKHLSTLLVAGISISFLFLFIIGVCCAWKKSKGSLAEINSVPSAEPGVSLKKISIHENQYEWPSESALQ